MSLVMINNPIDFQTIFDIWDFKANYTKSLKELQNSWNKLFKVFWSITREKEHSSRAMMSAWRSSRDCKCNQLSCSRNILYTNKPELGRRWDVWLTMF